MSAFQPPTNAQWCPDCQRERVSCTHQDGRELATDGGTVEAAHHCEICGRDYETLEELADHDCPANLVSLEGEEPVSPAETTVFGRTEFYVMKARLRIAEGEYLLADRYLRTLQQILDEAEGFE